MEHNRQNSGALLQSIIGNFKIIIGTSLIMNNLRIDIPQFTEHQCTVQNPSYLMFYE